MSLETSGIPEKLPSYQKVTESMRNRDSSGGTVGIGLTHRITLSPDLVGDYAISIQFPAATFDGVAPR